MKLQFDSQEELIKTTEKLMVILCHERYWTKKWMNFFGAHNRNAMENWQKKADALIRELQIEDQDLNYGLKVAIKIKNPETLGSEAIT